MPPERIVLYPGFHKTGTTSVHGILAENRSRLAPYVTTVLQSDMRPVLQGARAFSVSRDIFSRTKFIIRFKALLEDSRRSNRTLCIAGENLSGHLPGRQGITDFGAAIDLCQEMAQACRDAFPDAGLTIYFSTRAAETWLDSAYWEHVKSGSMTLDIDTFRDRFATAADLDGIVNRIAETLPVARHRIESISDAPWRPLLTLCDVPAALISTLTEPPFANTRPPPDVLEALLQANRTIQDKTERKQAKRTILKDAGTQRA